MTTLHKDLVRVARLSSPVDPAFNTRDKAWLDAATRYVRTRAPEHLAALPRKAGREPMLYGIGILTPAEYEEISRLKDVAQLQACARLGVKTVEHPDGKVETAPKDPKALSGEAGDAWLARLHTLGGARLVAELGHVARLRTELGDVPADEIEGDEDPLGRSDLCSLPAGAPLGVQRRPVSDAAAESSTSSPTTPG